MTQRPIHRDDTHLSGTIASITRRAFSVLGNPAFTIVLTTGVRLRTRANTQVAYELPNSKYVGVPVILTLSKAGTVIGIDVA